MAVAHNGSSWITWAEQGTGEPPWATILARTSCELAGLPVTVIHGEEDALIDVAEGRALAAGIPGARLVTIPACGHMLTTDAEATATRAVREHLSRGAEGEAEAASFAA